MTADLPPLSSTPRTRLTRSRERAVSEREALLAVLREALIGHVGVTVGDGDEAHPVVLPVAIAVDPDGPDAGGTLYLHGSVAAGWLRWVRERTVCVTVTHLDGLVAARSGMHHSMNYRSAVVLGRCRVVEDDAERIAALDRVIDHGLPGRAATLRPPLRKEMAATVVLAVPLLEASLKVRAAGVNDDPVDDGSPTWAGVVPLRVVAGEPEPDEGVDWPAPPDVLAACEAHR